MIGSQTPIIGFSYFYKGLTKMKELKLLIPKGIESLLYPK